MRPSPRVSPSLLVAIVAVVLASAGSAVAARLITSRDIRNGTIKLVDMSPAARTQLQGPRGPRGVAGPVGVAGPAGPQGPTGTPEPWTALGLAAGWTNHSSDWESAGFRKDTSASRVDLRGLITNAGMPAPGSTIATLPAGYRPLRRQMFAIQTGNPDGVGRLSIASDGRIVWDSGASGEKDYTSLSGISFYVD